MERVTDWPGDGRFVRSRVLFGGSRGWWRADIISHAVRILPYEVGVVTGGAYGADQTAEACCRMEGRPVLVIRPDWAGYGKKAGLWRNAEMLANAQAVVLFWDGVSRGTLDMFRRTLAAGIPVKVIRPDGSEVQHNHGEHEGSMPGLWRFRDGGDRRSRGEAVGL